jgi:hypothetical protein
MKIGTGDPKYVPSVKPVFAVLAKFSVNWAGLLATSERMSFPCFVIVQEADLDLIQWYTQCGSSMHQQREACYLCIVFIHTRTLEP